MEEKVKCPDCGMEAKISETGRCPRCNKLLLVHGGSCTGCGKCMSKAGQEKG